MQNALSVHFFSMLLLSSLLYADSNMHTADFSQEFPNDDPLCHNCHISNTHDVNITAVSYVCLDCHNGVMTESVRNPCCVAPENPLNLSQHPIFVNYLNAGSSSLKPMETPLDGEWHDAEKISDLLDNGQMLCTSCHQAHTATVRSANGLTTLCRGCHVK